jgi:hypothetical protein
MYSAAMLWTKEMILCYLIITNYLGMLLCTYIIIN